MAVASGEHSGLIVCAALQGGLCGCVRGQHGDGQGALQAAAGAYQRPRAQHRDPEPAVTARLAGRLFIS